jgi:hypothetical protein
LTNRQHSTDSEQLLTILDDIIASLSFPLTAEMRSDGWTDQAQESALEHLTFLRAKFRLGERPVDSDVGAGLSRWLDTYGVHGGRVLDQVSKLSVLMFESIDGPPAKQPLLQRLRMKRQEQQQLTALDKLAAQVEAQRTEGTRPED